MFNFKWIILGGLAILFSIIGLIYAIKSKNNGCQIMVFCSLSLGALTVFEEINVIWNWCIFGEFVALESTPQIISKLKIFLLLLISTNLTSLIVGLKRRK